MGRRGIICGGGSTSLPSVPMCGGLMGWRGASGAAWLWGMWANRTQRRVNRVSRMCGETSGFFMVVSLRAKKVFGFGVALCGFSLPVSWGSLIGFWVSAGN